MSVIAVEEEEEIEGVTFFCFSLSLSFPSSLSLSSFSSMNYSFRQIETPLFPSLSFPFPFPLSFLCVVLSSLSLSFLPPFLPFYPFPPSSLAFFFLSPSLPPLFSVVQSLRRSLIFFLFFPSFDFLLCAFEKRKKGKPRRLKS